MMSDLSHDMMEAARLTRAGKLAEATALLQKLVTGANAPARDAGPGAGARVIDGEYEQLDGPSGPAAAADARQAEPAQGWLPDALRGLPESLRGLPESLRGLMERVGVAHPGHVRQDEPAGGGSFTSHSFAGAAGSRDYKLFMPEGHAGKALPLVVMLHGCTQSPDDFAAGTGMNRLAQAQGFLVVYPAQTASANASRCWNWFNPADQGRERGEPALIAGITRQVIAAHGVDPARVYVAGLSAGGAAAAIMGEAYPELYAAVGVHSGLACGAARDLASALTAMSQGAAPAPRQAARRVPTIVFHGDGDGTVNPRNGEAVIARQAEGLRASVSDGSVPGGRAWTRTSYLDVAGRPVLERWVIHGAGHAWAGGSPAGSYTDPKGPDASAEMLRFFLAQPQPG